MSYDGTLLGVGKPFEYKQTGIDPEGTRRFCPWDYAARMPYCPLVHVRLAELVKLAALGALLSTGVAGAQMPRPRSRPAPNPDAGGWVTLACSNPGSQQDTAKTPVIQNTTAAPIPSGRSLLWKASDGDHGGVTLGQDLAPGDTVRGTGKPARTVYACSASFYAGLPDLVVSGVNLERIPRAVIRNTNAWIGAEAVRVRFESLRCADDSVLAVKNAGPSVVAAGGQQTFSGVIIKPWRSPPSYWRITVDFDRRVAESNEGNNVWSSSADCPRRKTHVAVKPLNQLTIASPPPQP